MALALGWTVKAATQWQDEQLLLRLAMSLVGELLAELPADVSAEEWALWLTAAHATVGPNATELSIDARLTLLAEIMVRHPARAKRKSPKRRR